MSDGDTAEPPLGARVALVAVVLMPIVVAVVRAVRNDWFPIGDSALLALRANDVLTEHHPLLGSWTSASLSLGRDVNNPGPLYQDLVAVVSRPLGFPSATAIGVGLVNGLSVIGVSAAARSAGGWPLQRWCLLAAALLTWILGSELLIDIWQPHALLLPSLLLVVTCAGLARGRSRLLPLAAFVASLLVQTHISYVFVLVALAVATAVAALAGGAVVRPPWRLGAATVALVALLWAQPAWEQLTGPDEGNLTRLASSASGGSVQLGVRDGVRFTARILGQGPWGLRDGFASLVPATRVSGGQLRFDGVLGAAPAVAVVGLLVVVLGGSAIALRRRRAALAGLATIGAVMVATAPFCLALVTVGPVGFAPHHVRWLWPLGVLVGTVVVAGIVELLAARAATVVAVGLTALTSVAAVPFLAQPQGPVADSWAVPIIDRARDDLGRLAELEPVRYDTSNLRIFEPYSSSVMARLQELEIEFRVGDPSLVRQLGDTRRADGDERARVFQLEGQDALAYAGDACLITRVRRGDRAFALFAETDRPCPDRHRPGLRRSASPRGTPLPR
ncbi:MAG TPA: hypothetical protein VM933_10970 [Acidimicrobiales bacterium]|nr:hypothetical protein [Acidimicrobiales bacterium]